MVPPDSGGLCQERSSTRVWSPAGPYPHLFRSGGPRRLHPGLLCPTHPTPGKRVPCSGGPLGAGRLLRGPPTRSSFCTLDARTGGRFNTSTRHHTPTVFSQETAVAGQRPGTMAPAGGPSGSEVIGPIPCHASRDGCTRPARREGKTDLCGSRQVAPGTSWRPGAGDSIPGLAALPCHARGSLQRGCDSQCAAVLHGAWDPDGPPPMPITSGPRPLFEWVDTELGPSVQGFDSPSAQRSPVGDCPELGLDWSGILRPGMFMWEALPARGSLSPLPGAKGVTPLVDWAQCAPGSKSLISRSPPWDDGPSLADLEGLAMPPTQPSPGGSRHPSGPGHGSLYSSHHLVSRLGPLFLTRKPLVFDAFWLLGGALEWPGAAASIQPGKPGGPTFILT
jgi:hypothetical protein